MLARTPLAVNGMDGLGCRLPSSAMKAVVEADASLVALTQDAERLFPANEPSNRDPLSGVYHRGLEPRAGGAEVGRTRFEAQIQRNLYESPRSQAHEWLAEVERSIAHIEDAVKAVDGAA